MHRSLPIVYFSALAASASAFSPAQGSGSGRPWTPAAETGAADHPSRLGWSPNPTGAPRPRYGGMELLKRDFTMGTNTCGFFSGYPSIPVTCVQESAYCTHDGAGNMDCCTGEYSSCTETMFSACMDYSASQRGACDEKGPRTICCWSESPSCYTLLFSTTATPNQVFSIFQCQTTGGLATILATPPGYSATQSSGSATPVGAIVGGVVGGVAVIGLVAFLIALVIIRGRRPNKGGGQPVRPSNTASHQKPGYPPTEGLADLDKPYHATQPQQPYQHPGYHVGHQQQGYQTYPHQYAPVGQDPYPSVVVNELPVNHGLGTQGHRAELD